MVQSTLSARIVRLMSGVIQERCCCRWIWAGSDTDKDPLPRIDEGFVAVQTLGTTAPTKCHRKLSRGEKMADLPIDPPWSLPFPESRIRTSRSMTPMNTLPQWPISRPTSTSWGFFGFVVTTQHLRMQTVIVCHHVRRYVCIKLELRILLTRK